MEQYTEAIRDVERRIRMAEEQIDIELPTLEQPEGVPQEFEDHLDLMLDLQLLALQTDLTRVITFMLGKEQSARPYPQIDVRTHITRSRTTTTSPIWWSGCPGSTGTTPNSSRATWRSSDATPDIDGSLLDNMTILYGSGISNSTRHSGRNLPLLVMGGGAGRLRTGRHLSYSDEPGMANLLVTLMDKMDVPVEKIGASTGPLPLDTLSGI